MTVTENTEAEAHKNEQASETVEPETAEATTGEANTEGESTEATEGRAKTQYVGKGLDMEVLDDLPEDAAGGRSRIYFDILQAIAEDSENLGRWHTVAKFGTDQGAISVSNTMNKQVKGKVLTEEQANMPAKDRPSEVRGFIKPIECKDIPEFEGWHWEFDARKVAREGAIGVRDSVLYAKLVQDTE